MLTEILLDSSPIYPLWGITMLIVTVLIVPRKDIKYLLPYAFTGTLIISAVLIFSSKVIKAWTYLKTEPYSVLGTPIFVLLAWGAAMIIFLWTIPRYLPVWTHYFYIGIYGLGGVVLDIVFHQLGLRPFASWYRSWMWFFPVFLVFFILYKIYMALADNNDKYGFQVQDTADPDRNSA